MAYFPNKRINEMMKSAKILVLVTHSMESAIKFCNKAILLKRGEILKFFKTGRNFKNQPQKYGGILKFKEAKSGTS